MQFYKCKILKNNSIRTEIALVENKNDLFNLYNNIVNIKKYTPKYKDSINYFTLPFFKNLYQLVINNFNIINALQMTAHCFIDERKLIVDFIIKKLKTGYTLSESLNIFDEYFDSIVIEIIQISEKTANISQSISNIISYLESRNNIKNKISKTIRYPITIFILVNIVVLIWLILIIPQFESIFNDLNIELSLLTKCIIKCSNVLINYPIIIGIIFISIIFCIKLNIHIIKNKLVKVPIINDINNDINKMQFFNALSLMLQANINLIEALDCLNKIEIFKKYASIVDFIRNGKTITTAIILSQKFEDYEISIISVGEKSGQIWLSLKSIVNILNIRINNKLDKIISILPTILMITAGVLLIALVYSTFNPLYNGFDY